MANGQNGPIAQGLVLMTSKCYPTNEEQGRAALIAIKFMVLKNKPVLSYQNVFKVDRPL